jgi:hypothetical protein
MHKFPSINQFRNVVQHVKHKASFMGLDDNGAPIYNHAATFPTLTFSGTVKLHGTNAAVVFRPDSIEFQSREHVLTAEEDNMGFYAHMSQHTGTLMLLADVITRELQISLVMDDVLAVYGEWCGGNIQKGIAISGLPKMFVIFAIKLNDEWIQGLPANLADPKASIYNIYQFPSYAMKIDFNRPELAQNALGELTMAVEAECPVGKHFGQSGVGEGIVWRCVEDPNPDLWFKVKGEKHSATKVKTLAAVDTEAVESMREFVEKTVTEARLQQGLKHLQEELKKPFNMTSMGDFIRWIHADVIKEESDTMAASGIDPKKIGGPIAQTAKRWYVEQLNWVVFFV